MEFRHNIISCHGEEFPYTAGVGSILYEKMLEAQEAPAQIDDETGLVDTYQSLLERCVRTAKAMKSRMVSVRDVVLVHSPNHSNAAVPVLASYFLGAVPAVIDYSLPLNTTVKLLAKIPPKIIFTTSSAIDKIFSATQQLGLQTEIVNFDQFDNFIAPFRSDSFAPFLVKNLQETAAIFFTSGTTGLPKKVGLSHKLLLRSIVNLQNTSARFTTVSQNTFWISTTNMLLNSIVNRSCRVLVPYIETSNLWELVRKYSVSVLVVVPSIIPKLFERPVTNDTCLSLLFVSGGSLTRNQTLRLRAHLPNTVILPIYGQTELGGPSLSFNISRPCDLRLAYERPTSCGRPHQGYKYKVVNPDTEETVGPNQVGEIRIKTDCLSRDACEASEWDGDGFYKTGDLGYYDSDFCFYVTDRIKEVFKYKAIKIAPSKLEGVLRTHPSVEDAVVVGVPHGYDGNHPLALIVLKGDRGDISEGDIERYFNSRVADGEKLRGGVRFVRNICTTSMGKVKRVEMRQLALQSRL